MEKQLAIKIIGSIVFEAFPLFLMFKMLLKNYTNWSTISNKLKILTVFIWVITLLGVYFFIDLYIEDVFKLDKLIL
jgi:hypothetical protein